MFKLVIRIFVTPTYPQLVQRELDQAKRDKLSAESHQEYYAAIVSYNTKRIARLQATNDSPATTH